MWARLLLPQVLGTDLSFSTSSTSASSKPSSRPAPLKLGNEAAGRALAFLDLILNAVRPAPEPVALNWRGYPKWNGGTVELGPESNRLVRLLPLPPLTNFVREGRSGLAILLQCLQVHRCIYYDM